MKGMVISAADVSPAIRKSGAIAIILICGFLTFGLKCWIVWRIQSIGGTDSASHAEMADSLIEGKGFSEDFIQYSHFFSPLRFSEVTHPSSDYQPLYAALVAPFFLIFGKSAFAAKLPAMLIGSLFLPVLLYLLTARLSANQFAALAAGLSAIVFPELFRASLRCDDDLLFATLVAATSYFIIHADSRPKHYFPAAIFIALAFYAKGTGLLLFPIYLLLFLFRRGFQIWRDRNVRAFFLTVIVLVLPWFIRNTLHFEHPAYSNAMFASGYIGYKDWETETYRLYTNGKRPGLFSKFTEAGVGRVLAKTAQSFVAYLSWSFGRIEHPNRYRANDLYLILIGLPALIGYALFVFSRLNVSSKNGVKKSDFEQNANAWLHPWKIPDIAVPGFITLGFIVFLSIFWEPQKRQALPFVLLSMVVGWTTLVFLVQRFLHWMQIRKEASYVALRILLCALIAHSAAVLFADYKNKEFPFGEGNKEWIEAGKWLRVNAPQSITMAREPSQLHFYSEQKAIQIPIANLADTVQVMKFYRVTHLIPWMPGRRALQPILQGAAGPVRLVYDKNGVQIYEIVF